VKSIVVLNSQRSERKTLKPVHEKLDNMLTEYTGRARKSNPKEKFNISGIVAHFFTILTVFT